MKTQRLPFWPYFGLGALLVFAAAGTTHLLHHYGAFERWENDNLDRWLLAKPAQLVKDIMLVVIDDADYEGPEFHGTSPLQAGRVIDVLEAIAKGHPKVIGVDLDTSHWTEDEAKRASRISNVVWARGGWEEGGSLKLDKLLGGFYTEDTCFGLPAVQLDDDGIVRRYSRTQQVGERIVPSFPVVVAEKSSQKEWEPCKAGGTAHESEEAGVLINFLGQGLSFRRLTSSAIVQLAKTREWQNEPDVRDKIVLVGGVFRAARDRYVTPLGMMDGVNIAALETYGELSKPASEASPWKYMAADITLGLLLVAAFYIVPSPWRLAVIMATIALVVLVSFTLFYTRAFFFSFVPILAGVIVHEGLESSIERRSLERENKELHAELQKLRTE